MSSKTTAATTAATPRTAIRTGKPGVDTNVELLLFKDAAGIVAVGVTDGLLDVVGDSATVADGDTVTVTLALPDSLIVAVGLAVVDSEGVTDGVTVTVTVSDAETLPVGVTLAVVVSVGVGVTV